MSGDAIDHEVAGTWQASSSNGLPGALSIQTCPEAMQGGPIAVVQDGDEISIDVLAGTIHLHVTDDELQRRLANWQQPEPKVKRGYLNLYARLATSADKGAILAFPDTRTGK